MTKNSDLPVLNWHAIVYEATRRRKERGLSQRELSVLIQKKTRSFISASLISNFENGENLSLSKALDIFRALDMLTDTPDYAQYLTPKQTELNQFDQSDHLYDAVSAFCKQAGIEKYLKELIKETIHAK